MKLKQITCVSLFAFAGIACAVSFIGCEHSAAKADSSGSRPDHKNGAQRTGPLSKADEQSGDVTNTQPRTEIQKPKRLKRGEMPEEWIEPQRERAVPLDTANGDKLDLTFDDLKFDIEIGQPFERSLLSEEVKALDGKEITLSGYMKPSFRASGLKGFIFVRDDKECCFGPQAAIYDCVRVAMAKGTTADFLVRPFKVRGKFYLKEREGPDGAIWSIFNMKNARIE